MLLHRLKNFALSLRQATLVRQWHECYVFKVAGKMFLLIVPDGDTIRGITLKCAPEEFDELTDIDGVIQAPYCAKGRWVQVTDPEALSGTELQARIRRSYDLVVAGLPKKTQAAIARD